MEYLHDLEDELLKERYVVEHMAHERIQNLNNQSQTFKNIVKGRVNQIVNVLQHRGFNPDEVLEEHMAQQAVDQVAGKRRRKSRSKSNKKSSSRKKMSNRKRSNRKRSNRKRSNRRRK
tara:strand:+ start:118 stop:471 length:354 start_codon:yes stop_codon:yes gene_type:complete